MTEKRTLIMFFVPSLVAGGAELHTVGLIERLRDFGFDCRLVVFGSGKSDVVTAHPGAAGALHLNLVGMSKLETWIKVWKTLRDLRPDLVVCINQGPLIVTLLERVARAYRGKAACIFHTTEMQKREQFQGRLLPWLSRAVDLLIYVAPSQQAYWKKRGVLPKRERVIANGIDLMKFDGDAAERSEARKLLGLGNDDIVFGSVAAYRTEKNHTELVHGLAEAIRRGSRIKVVSIGGGPKRQEVEELVKRLGLSDRYIFLGERRDVARCMLGFDAGVFTSTAESLPLAGLEMLASGLPMVVSSIESLTRIVKSGVNGLAYDLGNIDQLADALCEMERPASRRRLAAAARSSVAGYSIEAMVDDYREEFVALCS